MDQAVTPEGGEQAEALPSPGKQHHPCRWQPCVSRRGRSTQGLGQQAGPLCSVSGSTPRAGSTGNSLLHHPLAQWLGSAPTPSGPWCRPAAGEAMKEFLIILAGWGLGVSPSSVQGLQRKERDASDRDREAALVVVRLTTTVEPIAKEVSLLRSELKEDRQILDPRLNA
ncbi:MAG: hypothetical protein ACK5PF_10895, partial [bacterium]